MNPAPTDWTTAVAVLAAGLVIGAIVMWLFARKKTIAPDVDLERRDLEARRDALLQQLRDLDEHSPDRARLELETAQVLRKLDEKPVAVRRAAPSAPAAAVPAGNPALRGFLWGAGSVGALALMAYFVMQQAKPREEGGSLTGEIPQASSQTAQQQAPPDPALQQLEARVRQQPDDLSLRNELAKAYLERDQLMNVFEQTQVVLAKAPNDARALTYQGIVRAAMGDAASATRMIEAGTKNDPTLLDAWVALAWIRFQSGKPAEAENAIAEAARQHPEEKARLDMLLAQMKAASSGQQQQLPADHPPVDAAPPVAAPDSKSIRVTIDIDPATRARVRTGVIFLIARSAGLTAGPPAAVKRLALADLGTTVTIGAADAMMGQPFPDKVRIDARLDTDGDVATRPATDPSAFADGVSAGTAVRLVLK